MLTIQESTKKSNSDLKTILDVFLIFALGLFLVLLYLSFSKSFRYFIVSYSVYFILTNIFILYYMSQINNDDVTKSLRHRILKFLAIYNIFAGLFLIMLSIVNNVIS